MNKELIMALDALEKENGIDKEIMFAAIEKSLMDEYKAEFDKADNGRVELDRRTGDFHIYSTNSKEMYFIDTEKVENETIEAGDKKRGTILIVEDNNEIRHYLSSGLAELFNTLEAGNGEEALEKLV